MGFLDLLWHLTGFLAPAAALAMGMALAGRFWGQKQAQTPALWAQAAINFVVCAAVLLAGLAVTGHDGRMATYAALVLACAASQAWMLRRR